ncbi:MAG TPA: hypothetical protein VM509_09575 [Planctomycetota bacterium]|nr:hypothetical protein [Planctomycetota bacterium]
MEESATEPADEIRDEQFSSYAKIRAQMEFVEVLDALVRRYGSERAAFLAGCGSLRSNDLKDS